MSHLPRAPHVAPARRYHRAPDPLMRQAHDLYLSALRAANRDLRTLYWHELVYERYEAWARNDRGIAEGKAVSLGVLEPATVRRFIVWLREEHQSTNALTGRQSPLGAVTIAQHVRALKSFAHWLATEEILDRDPLANLRLPKTPKHVVQVFTEAQVRSLILAIEHRPLRTRNLSLLYLLLCTGARISEALNLTWGDIDFKERRARVLGKGKKERWLYFDAPTARLLERLRVEDSGPVGRVFLSKLRTPLTAAATLDLFRNWGEEAGVAHCHPHTTRHTFATVWLRAHPGQVLQLQELLGHSALSTVRQYIHFVEGTAPVSGPSVIESLNLGRVTRYLQVAGAACLCGWLILRRFDSILLPVRERIG